jgi:hypothetical protein
MTVSTALRAAPEPAIREYARAFDAPFAGQREDALLYALQPPWSPLGVTAFAMFAIGMVAPR